MSDVKRVQEFSIVMKVKGEEKMGFSIDGEDTPLDLVKTIQNRFLQVLLELNVVDNAS